MRIKKKTIISKVKNQKTYINITNNLILLVIICVNNIKTYAERTNYKKICLYIIYVFFSTYAS